MKKIKKGIKGITLVALVVTIIVLLILSGVAISLSIGEDGIFKRAQDASKIYENASQNELIDIEKVSNYIEDYFNKKVDDIKISDIIGGDILENTTKVKDTNGEIFFVPGGFKVSEETENEINKGIVIQDIEGNEFVWVPVQNIGEMIINSNEDIILDNVSKSTRTYSNLRIRELDKTKFSMVKPGDITSSREPDILRDYDTKEEYYKGILGFNTVDDMADSMIKEYNNMLNSINKYNGFYVGRYELTGSISEPTVKKGKVLTTQEAGNWYYLYRSCNNMINTMYAKTTMIYGCQWDEICEWLKECGFDTDNDSSKWGNYSNTGGTDEPTGSNEKWQANKIYDLAGNHWEFTQEAYSTNYRVGRAGAFGSTSPAADRNIDTPISLDTADTTRVTLYIK